MRVAIIKSNYTPYGGGEKYATRVIQAFAARGFNVDVLTAETGQWIESPPNINWITLRRFPWNNYLRLITFNASVSRYCKEARYDCIFNMDRTVYQTHVRAGGGCHAAWLERRCRESSPIRCLSFRLNPFHRAMISIERNSFLSDNLRRIFCNSQLVRDEIQRFYPASKEKLTVIHNGVEWRELAGPFAEARHQKSEIRRQLGLDPNKFYFLFIGSGYERKGLKIAVKALRLLPSHVELLVLGKDRNERAYRFFSDRIGLKERVHFFGPQVNVVPFFQVSDAFVLPTLYDPFSNATLEALAMGLYTITSKSNGCSEVIRDGAGCVIPDLRSIESVAKSMENALHSTMTSDEIRASVESLEFERQLNSIVDTCIKDIDG